MNKFKKYCPNVWVAECEEEYEKGEIIVLTTKYGKDVECEVYNLVKKSEIDGEEKWFYSIVRLDESYAERKANKYANASKNSIQKSNQKFEDANEGSEFLKLGEPIKIGHHSERKHRNLIERNRNRLRKAIELKDKAEEQRRKAEYWEEKKGEITLAIPESLEYFKMRLEKAIETHKFLKANPDKRVHAYSLTYAKKDVNEFKKKVDIAEILWSDRGNLE